MIRTVTALLDHQISKPRASGDDPAKPASPETAEK